MAHSSVNVDQYIEKINQVQCSSKSLETEFYKNIRREFESQSSLSINKNRLKGLESLLEDAKLIANVQTALAIGPLVGYGFYFGGMYLAYPQFFSLPYLTNASLSADYGLSYAVSIFSGLGMIPTYFLTEDFILENKESIDSNENFNDVKTYLSQIIIIAEIDKNLELLRSSQANIIENESNPFLKFAEDKIYWKKALRYESIINNIKEQQQLLTAKLQALNYQKEVLTKSCNK